jgi:glycosyltransferase involved in cell wall biosynthesis
MRLLDLAIYDDVLPSPASPFRTLEYGHYLDFFQRSAIFSLESLHHGFAHAGFGSLGEQLGYTSAKLERILPASESSNFVPRLAYVTFLGNACAMLGHFEDRLIPFIMQLYPGGSFEPGRPDSDKWLRRIVRSPMFRRVVATQRLTRDHLIDVIRCPPEKVEMIYGGVFESRTPFSFDRDKRFFGNGKNTLDVCFVAHRYGPDMAQKGYDKFVEVAQLLVPRFPQLHFHVVGDYRADDVPLGETDNHFTFYDTQPSEFFEKFYAGMDVILSANKPGASGSGVFDGFPTGSCMEAGFHGVLNAVADPLELNVAFRDGHDILIVERDATLTAERLGTLLADPDRLYAMARAGLESFRRTFNTDAQLWARTRIIVEELMREEALIMRPSHAGSWLDQGHLAEQRRLVKTYQELQEKYIALEDYAKNLQERYIALEDYAKFLQKHYLDLEERCHALEEKAKQNQSGKL